ncbi:MAG: PD-(D/E)XK nuclease domain-containing protein, partial [Burkholderiales bacterium]|nr:PD-(D/E)XK nuclease domain-containing protein [Burkholderiales bacterium]
HYFIPELDGLLIADNSLSNFDIEEIPLITLLFQTGYLTIKEVTTIGTQYAYILGYPNLEVKASLNGALAEIASSSLIKNRTLGKLSQIFNSANFAALKLMLSSHFASIPHDWYRNNDIANYEGFYASIVYSLVCALGYEVIAEDVTNHGKIDLTIRMPDKIIILEFKLSKYGSAAEAIKQIKERNYAEKYLSEAIPVYLLGISFDSDKRNIEDVQVEEV